MEQNFQSELTKKTQLEMVKNMTSEQMMAYLYAHSLSDEAAKALEEQGAEAIRQYFSEKEKYAPNRQLNDNERYLSEMLIVADFTPEMWGMKI